MVPGSPRITRINPAAPSILGASRPGSMGIDRIDKPTSAREVDRTLDSYKPRPGSGFTPTRTPQKTRNAPSAINPAGCVGNSIRPENARRISRAPSRNTMNSLNKRNRLIDCGIFLRSELCGTVVVARNRGSGLEPGEGKGTAAPTAMARVGDDTI